MERNIVCIMPDQAGSKPKVTHKGMYRELARNSKIFSGEPQKKDGIYQ